MVSKGRHIMKSVLKWGFIVGAGVVVIIIAALLIIPMFVDVKKYKPELEQYVSKTTSRPFSVGDDIKLTLFPWAGLSFSDLSMGNPPGFKEKEFVTVKSFEAQVKIMPLLLSLFKTIELNRFILNEPRIVLITNKDGNTNWAMPKKSEDKKQTQAPADKASKSGLPIGALSVGTFSIKNGTVVWVDHSTETSKEVREFNLNLKDVSLDSPMNLELSAILDKYPLSVQGTVGPVGQGFEGGKIPLDLKLAAIKELTINLKGNLENLVAEPGVDLDLEIDEFSPRKLVAALGQSFPLATSDPKALDRVALKAHVMANAKQAAVTNGKMDIDESKLNFSMQASQFSRPAVKFDLNLDQINVDRYLPPKSETAPKSEEAAPGTPKKTDYAPLRRLILDGQLKIGQLIASKAKIQDLLMRVTAKDGIINLDPLKMNLYQGKVAGKASLDVTKDVPKSSVNLLVDKVKVGPLLKDVLEVDVLEGAAEADVALAMEGDEPALIKKTLNGEGVVMFRDGAIVGIDLANMVRNVQSAFGLGEKPKERPRTDFTELNAPFTIKNGLVNTPNTSLRSPLLRIIAIGDAHLVNETIDFRVEPKAVATIKGQGDETQRSGIMVPVVVSGTFSAPKFRPDISAATKQEIKQKVLESKEAQKVMEKEEVKKIIEKKETKDLLKGVLGN